MKYFVSYSFSSGSNSGFGNIELELRKSMNTTSTLKEVKEHIESQLLHRAIVNSNVVILNFIGMEEDNSNKESSINREY